MMLRKSKWILLLPVGFALTGCSGLLPVEQSSPEVTVSADAAPISMAVLDERPYVLDKDKNPAFEGLIRSGFGIPYSHNTASNEAMSDYLGKRVEYAFSAKGVDITRYQTSIETSEEELLNTLKADGKKSVLLSLNEWKYDWHTFTDNSWYNVDVIVLDKDGSTLASKHFEGEEDIPSGNIPNEMLMLYKGRFETIFSDPAIYSALNK